MSVTALIEMAQHLRPLAFTVITLARFRILPLSLVEVPAIMIALPLLKALHESNCTQQDETR